MAHSLIYYDSLAIEAEPLTEDIEDSDETRKDNDMDKEEDKKDNFDTSKMIKEKKRIEESRKRGSLNFMGQKFIYKKNPWRGYGLIPQKQDRIWVRAPSKVERKPTEYQQVMAKIMKKVNERPEMKFKTGQERILIRRRVRDGFNSIEVGDKVTNESAEKFRSELNRIIDESVKSVGRNE